MEGVCFIFCLSLCNEKLGPNFQHNRTVRLLLRVVEITLLSKILIAELSATSEDLSSKEFAVFAL